MGKSFTFEDNPALQFISQKPEESSAQIVMRSIDDITTSEPFSTLFKINEKDLQNISASMVASGFDNSQALHIWKEQNKLIDGYTRLHAAKDIGIKLVPIYEHSFANEADALDYAIGLQKNRRNLSDADLLNAISVFDTTKQKGERSDIKGKSAEATAEKLGVSRATVERARSVEKNATDEQKKEITDGEKTINQVYGEIQTAKKKPATSDPVPPEADTYFDFDMPIAEEIDTNTDTPTVDIPCFDEVLEQEKPDAAEPILPEIPETTETGKNITATEETENDMQPTDFFDYESYKAEWMKVQNKINDLLENSGNLKLEGIQLISFLSIQRELKKIIEYIAEKGKSLKQ